jgi:ubiquinone/menaquinone biosynthesis C-methylase UbiE
MTAMAGQRTAELDYNLGAAAYARHRNVHPEVVKELLASGLFTPESRVLDVGCGTGNYAAALTDATACRISGIEPSARMLERARDAAPWQSLVQGSAEYLPFPDSSFDVVMSTDVIHHVQDRPSYFREAARVLRPGGTIVTVTDSHGDIHRRRPLTSHFPETVAIELGRYPSAEQLLAEMAAAGFTNARLAAVSREYDLSDIQPYRDRAFSSLQLIDEASFQRGLRRLERDLEIGPVRCVSLYTMIWGTTSPSSGN